MKVFTNIPWKKILILTSIILVLQGGIREFLAVASGTGTQLSGQFSIKWGLVFIAFTVTCIAFFVLTLLYLWRPDRFSRWSSGLLAIRKVPGWIRWPLATAAIVSPIVLFQYTYWGIVFDGPYIRLLFWGTDLLLATWLTGKASDPILSWRGLSAGLLLSGLAIAVAVQIREAVDYPFPLGWSEGNRLWDYSLLFGKNRYNIPPGTTVSAYLDFGRKLTGGLPFIIPGLSIWQERLWLGLIYVIPYLLLGWVTFFQADRDQKWFLAGIWGFLFLLQGPIHPPLILAATLVVLAWRRPLWLGIPLLILAAYFAQLSRVTWIFAPAIWIGMLEFVSAQWDNGRLIRSEWKRIIPLVLSGLAGSVVVPPLLNWLQQVSRNGGTKTILLAALACSLSGILLHAGYRLATRYIKPDKQRSILIWATALVAAFTGLFASLKIVGMLSTNIVATQPLLWYRLWPNSTYGTGILLGLLLAAGPLVTLLGYLWISQLWKVHAWQKIAVAVPLIAFLIVGLIVSTKIGGGGDLHNLDMFLISLLFVAALAWKDKVLPATLAASNPYLSLLTLCALVIPCIAPLMALRPISFAENVPALVTLTDLETPYANERDLRRILGSLPPQDDVHDALETLRVIIDQNRSKGDILFMDQRQLLTFGYIENVPLISAYEKKYLMDQAMAGNRAYFEKFYRDLASHRFVLIISDPLRTPIKDQEYAFGEENNAWVTWVAKPVLCFYQPVETFEEMRLQILEPNPNAGDCTDALPEATQLTP
jgi:hypothetical protein